MKHWPTKPLGELSETVMGQAPPGNESNFDGIGTPFVKAGEFGKERPIIREWTTKPLKFAKANDVLVCVVGATCGKLNLGADCAIGRSVAAIRPDEKLLNTGFLYAFLQGWTKRLRSGSQGSAQGVITRDMLASIPIPAPPLAEQERIVKLLDEANELRKLRAQADSRSDDLIPALFHEMFGDPVLNDSKWPLFRLDSIGVWASGGTPTRSKPEYFDGDVDWYSAGELNSFHLPSSKERITRSAIEESSAKLFKKGSLLVGMYDTAAFKMGILTQDASSNQACANIFPNTSLCDVGWLYTNLMLMKEHFLKQRRGVRQQNLSLAMIKSFQIPIPPLSLQKDFVQRMTEIRELEVSQATSRARLDALFQSMLHDAFYDKL